MEMDPNSLTNAANVAVSPDGARALTEAASTTSVRRAEKLNSLELGRGLAALFVLLYHYKGISTKYTGTIPSLAGPFVGGHAGVEYFFVLSGFIIFFVHNRDIGNISVLAAFFLKRAIRIIPMYWIVVTILLATLLIHPGWGGGTKLNLENIVKDYLLIPHLGDTILRPSWTLKREAFFYLLFGVIIMLPSIGASIFLFWQIAIVSVNVFCIGAGFQITGLSLFFLDVHNLGFFVGIFCASLAIARKRQSDALLFGILVVGFLGVSVNMYTEWSIFDYVSDEGFQTFQEEILHSFCYTVAFGLIVFALVGIERKYRPVSGAMASLFGSCSYLLYILHEPLGSLWIKLLQVSGTLPRLSANATYIIAIALTIATVMLLHQLIERPVTAWLRHHFLHERKLREGVGSG